MELRHLRYFVAVAEESSLGRAARRLHVSQPALSNQISELESELGLKLFTRSSRGVQLTEAGRVFLLGGRRALMAVKLAAEQAQEAAKGQRGRLVIGNHGALTVAFLPGILSRFRDQHPLVEITLLHLNNRAQIEALLNGSIMLGIGYYSWALEEDEQEQLSTRLLLRSPVGIICPKNRRYPKQPVPKLRDFRHDKFLSVDPAYSFGYEEWLRGVCKRLGGFEPDITASANSSETLIGLVASGRGIFLGPELTIRGREEIWRSVGNYYQLAEPESYFDLFAIWKKQSQLEPNLSRFIDVLVAELKSP
jgi:LysR family transcriptional regulator, benzoate and cis,cis-muconate-responsive activator of ben and cat genes